MDEKERLDRLEWAVEHLFQDAYRSSQGPEMVPGHRSEGLSSLFREWLRNAPPTTASISGNGNGKSEPGE